MLLDVRDRQPTDERAGGTRTARRLAATGVLLAVLAVPLVDRADPTVAPEAGPVAQASELLTLRTELGVLVADAATGARVDYVPEGVPSPDGSTIWRAEAAGDDTRLVGYAAAGGTVRYAREVEGPTAIRLVSWDGTTVVLGPRGEANGGIYFPTPRSVTPLVISGPDGTRSYELEGNYEPEALGTDGDSLFLISYLPPMDPDRYQVRRLDLTSGEVEEVFTPDEELQQEMGGTARVQAWGPDGRRLYTLYTLGEGGDARAFVHVLDLDGLWAHCVDLPDSFRVSDEWAVGMGVSADGGELYVADGASGQLVRVDTRLLHVEADATLPFAGTQVSSVTVLPDERLAVGTDDRLWLLGPRRLTVERTIDVPRPVVAVAEGAEVGRLAILADGRVVPFDPATGEAGQIYRLTGTSAVLGPPGGGHVRGGTKEQGPLECAC